MSRKYPDRPIVGVGVVAFREDDVLLIQRGKPPHAGRWSLPGGAQELGEPVRDAALREVREETGVEVRLTGLVDTVDSIQTDTAGKILYHYTLIDFVAEWVSGIPTAGDDARAARWVTPEELPDIGLWKETLRVIELARECR